MHFQDDHFYLVIVVRKKNFFLRDPFLKKSLVENNSYIYVYDFPQKIFSMCHGTYSTILTPQKTSLLSGHIHITYCCNDRLRPFFQNPALVF